MGTTNDALNGSNSHANNNGQQDADNSATAKKHADEQQDKVKNQPKGKTEEEEDPIYSYGF